MTITAISVQQKDKDRVNVFVDGKYRFSLGILQVGELGIRVGNDYSDEELTALEIESQFGKLYTRTLEYCLMRPHSSKEIKDYLYRKTRDTRTKTGAVKKGVSPDVTTRVYDRLVERGYIDDRTFSRYWIENRHVKKGISKRRLMAELRGKGVEPSVIEPLLAGSERSDSQEIRKIVAKKRPRYEDDNKLIQYLMRQGFRYDDIKEALVQDLNDEG